VIAVETEGETELGKIETEIGIISEETAFEKGIKQFGYMLMKIALILAGLILIINISMGKSPLDSILFALALSLGLAPELLPAIVSITLSAGARRLASKKVIVKRLSSIQNLGSINILCSDKTGTLTEGEVKIHGYLSADNKENPIIQKYAFLNATFESGYTNPMDEAIRSQANTDITGYTKFDEVPYDFIRKRLSIVAAHEGKRIMITKGALKNILEVCDKVQLSDNSIVPMTEFENGIREQSKEFSKNGFRTIGVCFKDVTDDPLINKDDENQMTFLGFILLNDPPKEGIAQVIAELKSKGVNLKIITGDNVLIAENIAKQIGVSPDSIISGSELLKLTDEALFSRVDDIDVFAETEPSQKERIIRALQQRGHVVGYLGDGINDASALKVADVGISVNTAVDVAKESADMILLEKELSVISEGITEGRKTYLNTLKYILIAVSANFGNMFSMAGASLLLPFLPLLPSQILLTNFLSDLPALAIASDNVDEEMLQKPRKWDIKLIRRFMIIFGLESSIFDFITFGALMIYFKSSPELFRSSWFTESVITEVLILLIIRTRRTFFVSRPGKYLILSSLFVIAIVLILPYTYFAGALGLVPIPLSVMVAIFAITFAYSAVAEISKKAIFKKMNY
ncbi:MAG: HAD-IC family P-type ATPase, partial [Bacteroidia bacterium]